MFSPSRSPQFRRQRCSAGPSLVAAIAAPVALALGLVSAGPAAGSAPVTGGGTLAQAIGVEAQAVIDRGAPGVQVLVRDHGRVERVVLGQSSTTPPRALRAQAAFRAGSTTKTLVAATLVKLAERGRLGLDDPVARWLPGLMTDGARITIRQLLSHTSGLAEYTADPRVTAPFDANPAYVWPTRPLAEIAVDRERLSPPGERWSYANANYVVAGAVIEAVTGKPWAQVVERTILYRLDAWRSGFPAGLPIDPGFMHGYVDLAGTLTDVTGVGTSFVGAAGMLTATAGDLAKIYGGLLAGRVIGKAGRDEMLAVPPALDNPVRYGLGLFHFRSPCGDLIGHDGELLGTSTFAASSPDGKRQVVVVTNKGQPNAAEEDARLALLERAYCAGA